jgi:hypothetical protein
VFPENFTLIPLVSIITGIAVAVVVAVIVAVAE